MTPEIQALNDRIAKLEQIINLVVKPDRYTFERDVEMFNGKNIRIATSTGTKIGTSGTQKLAFYGSTPIIRPTGVSATALGLNQALVDLGLITN